MGEISSAEFEKIELKIGEIVGVEEIPGSKNLLRLIVDFGNERKQSISGIKKFYKKEELVGRKFVFVTNLKKRKFMGEVSECMILAAENGENVVLICPEKDVEKGARVR